MRLMAEVPNRNHRSLFHIFVPFFAGITFFILSLPAVTAGVPITNLACISNRAVHHGSPLLHSRFPGFRHSLENPNPPWPQSCIHIPQMSARVRHCVECPRCHTFYLIAFNPYRNGSYLVRTGTGSSEEYTLYCLCDGPHAPNVSRWREVQACEVSRTAHQRGYGSLQEVSPINRGPSAPWFFSVEERPLRPALSEVEGAAPRGEAKPGL